MEVNVEKKEQSNVLMTITIPVEDVQKGREAAYHKLAKNVALPGFRPGKAPRALVERTIGAAAIMEEAAQSLIPDAYIAAIEQENIAVVGQPEINILEGHEDKPMVFTAEVAVKPEFELPQYKGVQIPEEKAEVSEKDLEDEIFKMRERVGKFIELGEEDKVEEMDFATIDFTGFMNGEPFEGGEAHDYPLRIGSHNFIPGFEEQLLGAKMGETREINVTFPQEYHAEEMAGKDAMFRVTIKGIKRREIPALDDEFVKDISEEWDTVDDLKKGVKERLQKQAEETAEQNMKNEALEKVIAAADFFIPECMIDLELNDMLQQLESDLSMQGMTLEQYCRMSGESLDGVKAAFRERAAKNVRMNLILEAVAKAENIEASEEDVTYYIDQMAGGVADEAKRIREELEKSDRISGLKYQICQVKAADLIYEKAEKTAAPAEEAKEEAKAE